MHICFLLDHILLQHQPLGVCYIAALLKKHGHKVSALNVDAVPDPIQAVRTISPDIVACSTSSSSAARYQEINRVLRDAIPGLLSLFGGPHPSFFPRMIDEDPCIDAICIGEGEYAVLELCDRLQKREDISDVPSLYVRTPEGIRKNPIRPFLTPEQMDNLPFPDREVVDGMGTFHGQTAFVITGRGCPFDCSYCFNHVSRNLQQGKWVRRRSVENVLEEIRWLKEQYGVVYVAFQDDTFILNRNWLQEFCPKYAREIGLPFICNVRADLTDEELVDLLAEAGCIRVATGIENGDDNIRRNILAKNVTSEQYRHACDLFNSRKIRVVGQNMIGVPGETVESVLSTIELNIQCRCHIAIYSFFAPFPGTKLGEMAKEYGFTGDMREIPREFQDGLAPSMRLERKELIELIGHCAHLFTSYPALFYLSRALLRVLPGDTHRASYLRLMIRLSDWMIQRNGGRLPTHWHQPKFIDGLIRRTHRNCSKPPE